MSSSFRCLEQFSWRTVSYDFNGVASPASAATYSNTLSQRLYGPLVGAGPRDLPCRTSSRSVCDLTGALLLGVVKERV